MEYSVAIRTLGTAGEKYQILLDSLNQQTIKPKKILVYIPYGYDLPKETIGWEEYVRCPKGMITQRSLPFDEIDTDYILFCDDDISLEPSSVQRLFQGLDENGGDCISPNTFPIERNKTLDRIKTVLSAYTFPRKNDGWAFRVMRNGSYTYNTQPDKEVLPSESAAGPCMLIKKSSYLSIHFNDERWLESFKYPLGEDLLFYYKMHMMGKRVLVHYNAGIVHLDAGTSGKNLPVDWIRKNAAISVIIPYRIKYDLKHVNSLEKIRVIMSCWGKYAEQLFFLTVKNLLKNGRFVLLDYIKGLVDGWHFVRSDKYQEVPRFDAYIN